MFFELTTCQHCFYTFSDIRLSVTATNIITYKQRFTRHKYVHSFSDVLYVISHKVSCVEQ